MEAIDTTTVYVMQQGSKERQTVSLSDHWCKGCVGGVWAAAPPTAYEPQRHRPSAQQVHPQERLHDSEQVRHRQVTRGWKSKEVQSRHTTGSSRSKASCRSACDVLEYTPPRQAMECGNIRARAALQKVVRRIL